VYTNTHPPAHTHTQALEAATTPPAIGSKKILGFVLETIKGLASSEVKET
jgi:hypothetical protein